MFSTSYLKHNFLLVSTVSTLSINHAAELFTRSPSLVIVATKHCSLLFKHANHIPSGTIDQMNKVIVIIITITHILYFTQS